MLTIKSIGHTADEVSYYANLGAAENHDYYSEDGVRPGEWYGAGAEYLGLIGEVDAEAFQNILRGLVPDGTRSLVQQNETATRKRRAGFDLTWSMPKSFSVLWSQVNDRDRELLDEIAKRAVLKAVDTFVDLCGHTRRGKNGATTENADPVMAVFSHDTARAVPGEAPDANRHYHTVVANLVIREDQTTGSLDARTLFSRRMKMALGAMMRAELSMLLEVETSLGTYRPERPRKKELATWFEIDGVPKDVIDAMSKRRKAIEKYLREHGGSGAKASERAALRTREGKERYTWRELNEAWTALGKEHGFTAAEAKELLTVGVEREVAMEANEVAERAIAELSKHKARFTENEILEQTAILAQCQRVGIEDIRNAVSRCIESSNELVRLQDAERVRAYTTKTMLVTERRMLQVASELNYRIDHRVAERTVENAIGEASTIRPDQAKAVRAITLGSDVVSITGIAGSGKTFALGVARKCFERAGYSVIGTALAAQASKELAKGSGIKSTHLHSLLYQIERGQLLISDKSVIVVDEAATVGTVQMETLCSIVQRTGAKVVLVGDHRQLQSIDAGAAFRVIGARIGTTELNKIVRQKEEWSRDTVIDFRDGRAERALTALAERDRLKITIDRDEAMRMMVAERTRLIDSGRGDSRDTLLFAGTNGEVAALNDLVQSSMRKAGQLGEYGVEIEDYKLYLGDRVVVTKNRFRLGLENGTRGEVVGVWEGHVVISTDYGIEVTVDLADFSDIELGYAMSVHKAQGATLENALVLTGDVMTDREWAYVSGSRARAITIMFTDINSAENIPELAELMNRSRQNEMAIEHLRVSEA